MITLENFINEELKKYNLNFTDFLLLVDESQDKPPEFHRYFHEIEYLKEIYKETKQAKYLIKLKNLLKIHYFNKVNPRSWIVDFFAFRRAAYEFEDKNLNVIFWQNLSTKWKKKVISLKLNESQKNKYIQPYITTFVSKKIIKQLKI